MNEDWISIELTQAEIEVLRSGKRITFKATINNEVHNTINVGMGLVLPEEKDNDTQDPGAKTGGFGPSGIVGGKLDWVGN